MIPVGTVDVLPVKQHIDTAYVILRNKQSCNSKKEHLFNQAPIATMARQIYIAGWQVNIS